MASCTRPSNGGDDGASSVLTTPPISPSQLSQLPASSMGAGDGALDFEKIHNESVLEDQARQLDFVDERTADVQEADDKTEREDLEDPRPYVDPGAEFDYYDQTEQTEHVEPQEGSDVDQPRQDATPKPPDASQKSDASQKAPESVENGRYPFPKFTDIDVFENYLENAEDMTYEELYRRTAITSSTLVAYQTEWDAIDKEIYEYEAYQKAEQKRAEEETKVMMEEERMKDDAERDEVAVKFKATLKLNGKKWQVFMAEKEDSIPDKTIRHLQNLRNPQFMAAARKKQQAAANRGKKLLNVPWPEIKKTKEDLEWERRQRGRYMDPVKFDDMKQADVYGFEYSAHIKHYGQQPMVVIARQVTSNPDPSSNPNGDDANEVSRNRTQRKVKRKVYEADATPSPEESEEDGQKKRLVKRPKIFTNGVEAPERYRGQSGTATPQVRTFASGKRVGRPPAKSKLQAVQLAQPSVTPEVTSGSEVLNAKGLNLNDSEHQELAPCQEAQLHDAAESLVNQTQTGNTAVSVVRKKHAGGRPKKIQTENLDDASHIMAPEVPKAKRRHVGGRPRKNPLPPILVEDEVEVTFGADQKPLNSKPKRRGRRVKKETILEDDLVQFGDENVLQSTEQDDGSQYTTSRPTTSDSNASASTFGSRRSARPATREKTNAREARASANRRGSNAFQGSSSLPTSNRTKRKRASSDTDPSPIVVEPILFSNPEPLNKKRKTRGKQDIENGNEALPTILQESSTVRSTKRKRGNTVNESIAVAGPFEPSRIEFAPPPKKPRRRVKVEQEKPEGEEYESNADIDEDLLDPVARETLRKQRIKQEKSRKLSENMKARWAKGGMKEAQETRKANNALKRAHKAQSLANEAAGLPPPPPPILLGTQPKSGQASTPASVVMQGPKPEGEAEFETSVETPVETPAMGSPGPDSVPTRRKRTKSKTTALLPKRPASTRARKPTRLALGLDGAGDEVEGIDEADQEFASEYDQFQALTSPRKPVLLGKRVRRSLVDLSQLMDSDNDESSTDAEDMN